MSGQQRAPIWFVVPDTIDDPARVSGGNVYDQHVRDGLARQGRRVELIRIADGQDRQAAAALAQLPDGVLVLIDGLIAEREPTGLAENSTRLRVVVLAHMPPEDGSAFRHAERVIATSHWTRSELIEQDFADPHRIVVATPGTDPAPATTASETGARLLCVAAVAPHKGQDLLISALAGLPDDDQWTCTFVGSLDVAPAFVAELTAAVESAGLAKRVTFTGVLTGRRLADEYAQADLLVAPSRAESYGMVVTEAYARGIPVVASGAGGLPEAVGSGGAGIIVLAEDAWALGVVLRQWLASPVRRHELKTAALAARDGLQPWSTTTAIIAATLDDVALTGRREVIV
ncbi:glycosyltransferase family 4 protein [Diaminobutyricibacter tongyongensis]|uniref:D-inositol 3-phosphate glycosyltransferase n=1 Tax=Leifsonia tongyongensis TaxID=1268043 RepID=A0A6L9XTF2_9MICO|nr:glycosyltransferase family 4 protein [Diaminobutyricibacter tongyongensis]